MAIKLTAVAAQRVRDQLYRRGHGVGLRLGARRTGCSGWSYVIEFADSVGADDTVFEDDGVKVIVESQFVPLLDGTEVDFGREGLNESFRFRNPNVEALCGCGESFSVAAG